MATTGGFSSYDPKKASGPQIDAKTYTKLYSRNRSSGGSSRNRTPSPSVLISGGKVFINGAGYSVAPALQAEFIRKKTGGVGSSAASAIKIAEERAEQIRQSEIKRLADAIKARESEVNKLLANESQLNTQRKIDEANKKINSYNRLLNSYSDVAKRQDAAFNRKYQGYSGFGLSPSQIAKRNLLVGGSGLKEVSNKDLPFTTVDPLVTTFFKLKTPPTVSEKKIL